MAIKSWCFKHTVEFRTDFERYQKYVLMSSKTIIMQTCIENTLESIGLHSFRFLRLAHQAIVFRSIMAYSTRLIILSLWVYMPSCGL